MSRIPVIAANWKMNPQTLGEAVGLGTEIASSLKEVKGLELLCFIPAPFFSILRQVMTRGPIRLGAQNIHYENSGAFTGENSVLMFRSLGAQYILSGHSERRHVFHESDAIIRQKVEATLDAGLNPLLCLGESEDERESGKTQEVLSRQLSSALEGLTVGNDLVLAYEPVWAIGTGKVASQEQIQEAHAFIRNWLRDHGFSEDIRILYGGSVKPENAKGILALKDVDGALVGGASLQADSFQAIVEASLDTISSLS